MDVDIFLHELYCPSYYKRKNTEQKHIKADKKIIYRNFLTGVQFSFLKAD